MADYSTAQFDARTPPSSSQEDGETEPLSKLVARYWTLVRKYYWILIAMCVIGVVAAYFYTERQPRIFEASAKIIFRDTPANVFGSQIDRVELVDASGWHFEQFWNTQREVMSSPWFAEQVVEREGLLDVEGFVPAEGTREERLRAAAAVVSSSSSVSLQPNSKVARITATAQNPEHTKLIADGIAQTYVQYTRDFQSGGISKIAEWFDSYVGQKRDELDQAKTELHRFKRDNNILSISYEERQNLTGANIEAVNRQLNEVRGRLDADESLLAQIERMQRGGDDLRTLVGVVEDGGPLRAALSQEQDLRRSLAEVTTSYGPAHEKVRSLTRQLEVVQQTIDDEIARIRAATQARVAKLRNEAGRKTARLDELKEEAFELNELGLQYNRIKDKSESLGALYDTVLKRSEELDINSLYESKAIDVLQSAEVPAAPVSPNLPINLAIGLAIGLLLGGALIVLIDGLDNTVRSEDDVDRVTKKPILGYLPQIDPTLLKEFGSIDTMTEIAPRSSFAEGIKTLRTNLMFMSPDNPPQLLLVTSPGPGEGKTLISMNMSIAMAHSGQRTLVVDSDMRRPRVHKALGVENTAGLADVLLGKSSLNDAIRPTEIENLSVLSCGEIPPNPLELLHTKKFQEVIAELRRSYDRVIFDSPPLAVSDGLVLSHSVDAVLLILKFGKTRRELLKRSVEQLEAIGAPFMGCVLNDISASTAGYAYSYYYYRYRYEDDEKPKKPTRLAS